MEHRQRAGRQGASRGIGRDGMTRIGIAAAAISLTVAGRASPEDGAGHPDAVEMNASSSDAPYDADAPYRLAASILRATGVRGGLVVHVDCGDGRLTAALGRSEGFLVHGLARSPDDVAKARSRVRALGRYGPVSIDRWDGRRLPHAENLVNLVVATEGTDLDATEIRRVLAPGGAACVERDGAWTAMSKPRPAAIDEWTHFLHGPDGNPVARDTVVGPPRRLQWVAGPRWARHHDHMASMTSLVASGGRLFAILDEGPTASIQLPPSWRLIARDAFNGTVLWRRELDSWNTHQWPLKSGPAHLTRRLVAVGERVYATLGLEAATSALDAATGRTVLEYEGSERTREIIVVDGTLLAVVGLDPSRLTEWRRRDAYVWDNSRRANTAWAWAGAAGRIIAYDAARGEPRWQVAAPVAPCSLAARGDRAIFHDGEKVVCLALSDGGRLWESEPLAASLPIATSTGPRTILHGDVRGDVALFAGNTGILTALSAQDGRRLWQAPNPPSGHQSLRDLLVAGGVVWSAPIAGGRDSGVFTGRDPLTGEVRAEFPPDVETYWFHHRCYPSKATDRFILTSRTGIEFVDTQTRSWDIHHWVRGGCIYGVLPCNGLVYAPMHSCGCYLEAKLNGFNALAPGPVAAPSREDLREETRLEPGPAYGYRLEAPPRPGDWPTYRRDAARSGSTPQPVEGAGEDLRVAWRARVGGRLSSPVVADGIVFVASIDEHVLHALDAGTGRRRWTFTAGGRIDSPPTIHEGLALFGSADGSIYALRATDGMLAWRYRAAPLDLRVTAYEQVESVWPVHGSVLVVDGALHATAGRSVFLDGGIRFLKLDPVTGRKLGEAVWDDRDPETGRSLQVHVRGLNMPVALSDVLSSDGRRLYMRSQMIDLDGKRLEIPVGPVDAQHGEDPHLFCQIGFLDDSWFHRSYWTYGRRVTGGYGGWPQAGRYVPAGRILAVDSDRVYGYGRKPEYYANASVLEYHLFAAEARVTAEDAARVRGAVALRNARSEKANADSSDWKLRRAFPAEELTATRYIWRLDQPALAVRAMAAAGDRLYVAGYPDAVDERRAFRLPDDPEVAAALRRQAEAVEGRAGGHLWVVSKEDGRPTARYRIESPPVFDGLVAAGGRLFLAAVDGSVLALGGGSASDDQPGRDAAGRGEVDTTGLWPEASDAPLRVASDEPDEPDYLKPLAPSRAADFEKLARCRVVASDLGYRIEPAEKGQTSLALKTLDPPRTGKVSLTARLRVPEVAGFLVNGFVAFGDGATDERLVKCGIRLRTRKALVVQGALRGDASRVATADVAAKVGETLDLAIEVDLDRQVVTFGACGRTVEAALVRPLRSITHVGYATDGAFAEFGAVEVAP